MPAFIFPQPSAGPSLCYPVERTIRFRTGSMRFLDDSVQRWKKHTRLETFAVEYSHLSWSELAALRNFFLMMRGAYHRDFAIAIDPGEPGVAAALYDNCSFAEDAFTYSEPSPERYAIRLLIRQVVNPPALPGALGAFPALATGARVQRNYQAGAQMLTLRVDMPESEYRWATPARNALTHAEHYGLCAWNCGFPVLTPAEAAAIEGHFVAAGGRWGQFPFTDPEGATHPRCRYGADELVLRYEEPGRMSAQVVIEEDP